MPSVGTAAIDPIPEPSQPESAAEHPDRIHNRGSRQADVLDGPLLPLIIRLAIPSAITNLLNYSYNFINMLWLGRLGPDAIAVVSTYHYFFMVLVIFNQIVGLGSVSLIARSFGARQLDDCRRVIGQTFSFKLVIAFVVMVLGLVFQRWAWTAIGTAPAVVPQGLQYTTIMFSVIPFYFSVFTLRTSLTAIGDMRTLLKISVFSSTINILLDPVFIFDKVTIGPVPALGWHTSIHIMNGLGLGVAGAAWASFAAILVLFCLGQYYFMTGKTYVQVPARTFFSWNWHTVWRILRVGTPPAIGENLSQVAQIVNGRIINIFGTSVFAAHGVLGTFNGLVFVPVSGVGQAVMAIVGQNLGAGKPERAHRAVLIAASLTSVLLTLMLAGVLLWSGSLVRLFIPGQSAADLETADWAVRFLHIALISMLASGFSMVFGSAFWGSGYTRPPMYITLATTYLIQLPLTLYGAYVLELADPSFVIWIVALSGVVNAMLTLLVFCRGRWKTVNV